MNVQLVIDSLTRIITDIINFIPNLINGTIIFAVGLLIARLVRWATRVALGRLRFDSLIDRTGVTGALRGMGVNIPLSHLLAQTFFGLLLLSFLITSTRLMGLEAVARLLEQLLLFLPNMIAALIIFVLGGMAAQFVGGLITATLTAGGVGSAARVGRAVQYLISLFVVILALSELGVDTALLVTAVTIAIGAFGLALGLGLGLGARSIVQHILAGFYVRQRFPAGQLVVVGDVRGTVTGVGAVNTVIRTDTGSAVLPNTTLLEAVVQSAAPPE
jgi:small-conductance mechanosensitive channel